jgi:purine nucleosidase
VPVRAVIIDGDPGVDDAVALLLAFAAPELEVLAVTTVAGNVDAARTARNARIIREIAGREDTPVHAGATRPLLREPVAADHFHGPEGLGDLPIGEPAGPLAGAHAVQALIAAVMARPAGSIALACMGPLTNLALAMRLEPALAARLGPVVVMGGAAREGGNITPAAEYNIFADPHAAAIVFDSGVPVTVLGLDATHQVRATAERINALATLRTRAAETAARLMRFSSQLEGQPDRLGAPLHDPCTVAWLLRPELFDDRPCRVAVETASPLTLGATVPDFGADGPHRWVSAVDAEGVFELLSAHLGRP